MIETIITKSQIWYFALVLLLSSPIIFAVLYLVSYSNKPKKKGARNNEA